jgi:hypothetical protein
MKLRGVSKKSRCPLLKFFEFFFFFLREMRSFLQSSSDSQGRLWAREKSILKIVYLRLLVPDMIVRCDLVLDVQLRFYESKQAIHVAESKIRKK